MSDNISALIGLGILFGYFVAEKAIDAVKKVKLAKLGYREGRDGNLHNL